MSRTVDWEKIKSILKYRREMRKLKKSGYKKIEIRPFLDYREKIISVVVNQDKDSLWIKTEFLK